MIDDPAAAATVVPSSAPAPRTDPRRARRPPRRLPLELAAVVVLLALAVAVHQGTMTQRLVERHGFRQTQTAITAVDFQQHGIDLLHPRLPIFGTRSEVPFEFPLFQAAATVPMNLGLDTDMAMRVTGLFFFLVTAVLLYGLVRRVAGVVASFGALVAFLFSPFGLQWSRTSLVEYLATAAAVAFVWTGIEWRERKRWIWVGLAVVAGSVAMLVKITTGAFWILPLVLYTVAREQRGWRTWLRNRLEPGLVVAVAIPLLAGLLWTRHADAIKDAHAATRILTSANLQDWNFGTFAQRQVSENWTTIFDRMESLLVGRYLLVAVVVAALVGARRQRFWLGMVLVVVLAPVVFFNLYLVHDYYLAAVSPALAALVGLAVSLVWSHRPTWLPKAAYTFGIAAVWLLWALWPASTYVDLMYQPVTDVLVNASAEVRDATPPGSAVVYLGEDWNPTTPYYADRPGLMLPAFLFDQGVVDHLPLRDYRYVFSFSPATDPIQILRRWPWVGVVGPRMYVVGERRADVADAPVFASTATAASPSPAAATLVCGSGRIDVSPAAAAAGIAVDAPNDDHVRIFVRDDLAPLPRVGAIYGTGAVSLRCAYVPSISVVVPSG